MQLTFDQLVAQALQLPVASRARLADQLVESLADAPANDIDALWAAEARRRVEEIRSGKVQPIPGDQVLARVRRMVGR